MKNTNLVLLLLLCVNGLFAQSKIIEVSKNHKIVLIFPSPIVESTIGDDVSYLQLPSDGNSLYSKRILKLSYNRGVNSDHKTTNLDIITEDGYSYIYTLKYAEKPSKFRFNVSIKDASSNVFGLDRIKQDSLSSVNDKDVSVISNAPRFVESNEHKYSLDSIANYGDNYSGTKEIETKDTRLDSLYINDRDEYYRNVCFYNSYDTPVVKRYFSRNDDLFIWLKGVYYARGDVFVSLKIENKHSVDLDVDFINYHIATDYNRKSSNQETQLKPVYIYKQPDKVDGFSDNHFIIVFKKFVLEKKMVFRVNLKEKNGARILELDIGRDLINNPILL